MRRRDLLRLLAAARIKAGHKLSVADAWIAATAERLDATLVHKDPEFEPLAKLVRLCLRQSSGLDRRIQLIQEGALHR